MKEEWRDVIDYEGKYLVSNTGKIKSVPRSVVRSNGRRYTVKSRILETSIDSGGYERAALSGAGKLKTIKVHREVAKAFLSRDGDREEVNHIDGVKTNNNVTNLEWCNRPENMRHAYLMQV